MVKNILFKENMEFEDLQRFEWGEVAWIHQPKQTSNERISIGLVKISPNSKHERHFHFGEEQVLFTLEGSGIQVIDGEENIIKPGMIMHCPPYSEHEVINTGDGDLTLIIIYTPAQFGEIDQSFITINKTNILDSIDKDIIERIQMEVSSALELSITFLDNKERRITDEPIMNEFCKLCTNKEDCEEKTNKALSSPLMNTYRVNMCKFNILTITVPISIDNTTVGYIKCGHLLINKPKDIEEKIRRFCQENKLDYEETMDYYHSIPLVLKSRLYSLSEYLTIIAQYVSRIIANNAFEKEMIEKNNQIIEKTKETLNLENALKEANVELLKTKVSTNLKNINFNDNSPFQVDKLIYPLEREIELLNAITNLDENLAINAINKLLENNRMKNIPISKTKNIVDELFAVVSRAIYNEIKDIEVLHSLRNEYKNMIYNCSTYGDLLKSSTESIKDYINLLTENLFEGEDELIKKVNLYIKKNYTKELTLKSIAEVFYISPNYLSSEFNERNKTSLTEYINKIRINNAKKYLTESNMKISIIAKKVGYNNLSYFSQIFKKIEQCTPKQYRTKNS